ncbi:serine hydrolase domain-containing protein [Undibacterium oligocarboniphilum]|uniref:Beta-lactamase family protein n=1 Tax=Undibacterium oligocarboniphilum TaxID=666702 RepID=A0A850QE61_9BURK|nr:serine hydrolase domain-containing protein [Undibacterium oligocarboniphilum]MBC3869197.1 beta-lactamase family protein [Undibacterium oligocarboniphilum]NVO77177.1 beta-lactamase family protein [Undibacterium oligocarboniphilum]
MLPMTDFSMTVFSSVSLLRQTLQQRLWRSTGRSPMLLAWLLMLCSIPFQPLQAKENSALETAASQLEQSGFRGMVLAARGDHVYLQKSLGTAGNLKRPFRFASVTKQMTAILVMQEVEAGRLQLDAPLANYWPDYPNPAARKATLRQLLMHYSGLFNENAAPTFHMLNANNGDNMQAFASGICAGPMNSAPGSRFDYNNCDYLVLGALLEKITRQPFVQLLEQRIFKPAGMNSAGLYQAAMPDNPAHLHGTLGGQPEPEVNLASYGAAGSTYGMLGDLLAFDRALIRGKLLSTASRAEMTRPNATGGALGVWVYPFKGASETNPTVIVERQGWIAGVRILNLVDLQTENILILVSTNGDLDLTQTWANQGPAAPLLKALIETR